MAGSEALTDPASGTDDAAQVFALMGRLVSSHRLAWQIDIAPQDIRPERSVRALLAGSPMTPSREPVELAVAEPTAARDDVAAAARRRSGRRGHDRP